MSETLHFKEKVAHQRQLQPILKSPPRRAPAWGDQARWRQSLLLGERVGRARHSPSSPSRHLASGSGQQSVWEEHLPLLVDAGWKVPALPSAAEMSAVSL